MNHTQLGNLIRQKRTREGLSLDRAARLSGVSENIIWRLEHGITKTIYGDNLSKLMNWLSHIPEGAVSVRVTQPLPDVVSEILASDPALTGDSAARLTMLFRNAYEAMTA